MKQLLTELEKQYLQKLGLSEHAIELYGQILLKGSLTAKEAAAALGSFASAEYRLFQKLEAASLVRREAARPLRYTAIDKKIGLRAAYLNYRHTLEELVRNVTSSEPQDLELVIGRQALYKKYSELADQSQKEICIYAIGIAYSAELLQTQRAAMRHGVMIRHIMQQLKPSNYHVVDKWLRIGIRLRYAPAERGFHVMIFDSQTVIITFSDKQNTDDRLSIVTSNAAAVRLFEANFRDIWSQSSDVAALLAEAK